MDLLIVSVICVLALVITLIYVTKVRLKYDSNFLKRFRRGVLVFVVAFSVLFGIMKLTQKYYFVPRYGGIAGFIMDGWMASSRVESLEGSLGHLRSALSIYYGDNEGVYPINIDSLLKHGRYLNAIPQADIVIEKDNGTFGRAHWHEKGGRVKYFSSQADSDDDGGWGYVNDPQSNEFGTIFINCNHLHWKRKTPWNLSFPIKNAQPIGSADRKERGR